MRRASRPRQPNQRTCKHDFFRLYSTGGPGEIKGVALACAKCFRVRRLYADETFIDGPITPQETPAIQWHGPGGIGSLAFDGGGGGGTGSDAVATARVGLAQAIDEHHRGNAVTEYDTTAQRNPQMVANRGENLRQTAGQRIDHGTDTAD